MHRSSPLFIASVLCLLLARTSCSQITFPLHWDAPTTSGPGFKALAATREGGLLTVATRHRRDSVELICLTSSDGGSSWALTGTITSDSDPRTDLGDSMLLVTRGNDYLCSYRRNHLAGKSTTETQFRIEVARSSDAGATWQLHSTVAECSGTKLGLWSSFLLETRDGELQCYYDDEFTPSAQGLRHHQWLTMKTWNSLSRSWERPVTVSRAYDPNHLSRDGMCSVLELADRNLLCVFETVRPVPPHKARLMMTTSRDSGRTWSWQQNDRRVVYETSNTLYNALCPWTATLPGGGVVCVFVTDEDRPTPDTPSTGKLDESVKAVYSIDGGQHWTTPPQPLSDLHGTYAPGIVVLESSQTVIVRYRGPGGSTIQHGYFHGADAVAK